MRKQNVNIINFKSLYEILEEIKENLSFNIIKYEKNATIINLKENDLIIVNSKIDYPNTKNLLTFNDLPISLVKLIELININLIKLKFNYQSKININGYELNLNSKFFSRDNINLKLTEKEMEIILYLDENKIKHSILELQKNIWAYSPNLETHTVETHIYRLRKKINDKFSDSNFIKSHSDGYFIK